MFVRRAPEHSACHLSPSDRCLSPQPCRFSRVEDRTLPGTFCTFLSPLPPAYFVNLNVRAPPPAHLRDMGPRHRGVAQATLLLLAAAQAALVAGEMRLQCLRHPGRPLK